jgi:DNA-binding transcriptional MerR regulator
MAATVKTERSVRTLPVLNGGNGASRSDAAAAELLQVGELARLTGKTVRAIHHYEGLGLLIPDARSKGRFRLYDPAAVTRVHWISKLHDLGMSLSQIKKVTTAWETAPTAARAMAEVREMYRERLEETRAQLARLGALETELEASIRYLDTCDACDPNVLAGVLPPRQEEPSAACDACQRREREAEPDLVAGIVS